MDGSTSKIGVIPSQDGFTGPIFAVPRFDEFIASNNNLGKTKLELRNVYPEKHSEWQARKGLASAHPT